MKHSITTGVFLGVATFATAVTNDAGKYIGSEMWSPPVAPAESSSGLYRCSYSRQARWSSSQIKPVGFAVAAGVKYSSSDSSLLLADRQYGHKVDSGQKLFQFAF
jgi:hypothetical protein